MASHQTTKGRSVISSAANTAINNISYQLGQLSAAANKISDPNQIADAADIVAFKEASAATEISVAVLNKINQTHRLVDVIA